MVIVLNLLLVKDFLLTLHNIKFLIWQNIVYVNCFRFMNLMIVNITYIQIFSSSNLRRIARTRSLLMVFIIVGSLTCTVFFNSLVQCVCVKFIYLVKFAYLFLIIM